MAKLSELKILLRGGGEMASGVAYTLRRSHFTRLVITEIEHPTAIRRKVCFSEAIYDGETNVEGVKAVYAQCLSEIKMLWEDGIIPVMIDPAAKIKSELEPDILIDGTMVKKNSGASISDAPLVIALGPGFHAGRDAHCVIETNRGHNLARIITEGSAEEDTGVPAPLAGVAEGRVLRAPCEGIFHNTAEIGDAVRTGEVVGNVEGVEVAARIDGMLRGLIRPGIRVATGMKIGDIDPRGQREYCHTISDKARTIAIGVLQAILMRFNT